MSGKVNVAILGTGMSLKVFHRPSIIFHESLFNLYAVLERSGKGTAKEICGEGVKVVSSYEEILGDEAVDLVSWRLSILF